MSDSLVVGLITALATVLAAAFGVPRVFRDIRTDVLKDLQIFGALPDSSEARAPLLRRIEDQLKTLEQHGEARRRPLGVVVGSIFLGLAIFGGWYIVTAGGLWHLGWPLVLFVFILGSVGFFQDVSKRPRDSKGNLIK